MSRQRSGRGYRVGPRRGFTVTECLLAMMLLAVLVPTMGQMFVRLRRLDMSTRREVRVIDEVDAQLRTLLCGSDPPADPTGDLTPSVDLRNRYPDVRLRYAIGGTDDDGWIDVTAVLPGPAGDRSVTLRGWRDP